MEQYGDFYDIIIENAEKEWDSSMINYQKEKWESPQYSNNKIKKAGQIIINDNSSNEDKKEAMIILNNWRSSHAYPLQVIASNLRRNTRNAIVVQRLKRLDSIIGKLKRNSDMGLDRMQDLGGCRVIVDTIDEVYEALNNYKRSRIRHEYKKHNDYIQNPKSSGYRSYHMIYKFHSDTKETYNKNMLIEIQFRTKLQHTWATAIEMMGIYTKSPLKAGDGDKRVLRFFALVSSLFALEENMPVVPNTSDSRDDIISEIKSIDDDLKIMSTLSALKVATKHTHEIKDKNSYYLLILNYETHRLRVNQYPLSQLDKANTVYKKIEDENDPNIDVVLVSANSFDTMRAAYPNYFYDISKFIDTLKQFIK